MIIAKILNIIKTYQHGLFIGLCMILTTGIGYNIGRISALHKTPLSVTQEAKIYSAVKNYEANKTSIPNIPKDLRVVASKASKSKLYHFTWCSGAKRIKEENKLWFSNEAEAISAGYALAGNCQ